MNGSSRYLSDNRLPLDSDSAIVVGTERYARNNSSSAGGEINVSTS